MVAALASLVACRLEPHFWPARFPAKLGQCEGARPDRALDVAGHQIRPPGEGGPNPPSPGTSNGCDQPAQ